MVDDPHIHWPPVGSIPQSPGVYRFYDDDHRVIYVGKAKSLRSRLSSYFIDTPTRHPRTQQMLTRATHVEWTVVNTEVEALQLEYCWIKEFNPPFNICYRDDKTYPMLAVTLHEQYPRLMVYRGPQRKGVRYFGPYPHVWAIRDTIDLLGRIFPIRTCSAGVFRRQQTMGRPCLLGDINKCSAPCVDRISADDHRQIAKNFCDFLTGNPDTFIADLRIQMQQASQNLEFEKAARIRDDISAIQRAFEKQTIVLDHNSNIDVMAFAEDELHIAIQVFHIRTGRVRGQRGWITDKLTDYEDSGPDRIVEQFLTQFYGNQSELIDPRYSNSNPIPREILVPSLPANHDQLSQWLSEKKGKKVHIHQAKRGPKYDLSQTVKQNATEALRQHKLKRSNDLTTRSLALQEIQQTLGLSEPPLRIECIDISHIHGTNVVGSLVVFEDGLPRKSDYRRYSLSPSDDTFEQECTHDVAWIRQVTYRRFRQLHEHIPSNTPRRFAYPPNLYIVDGGSAQVNAAQDVLNNLSCNDITTIGIAKRLEEIWLPYSEDPIIFPRQSEALYLLQRIRDEAHRFAITHHRHKRSKHMTDSQLDSIPGVGAHRRKILLNHFGSLANIQQASCEQIAAVPGIGMSTAAKIVATLHTL